MHLVEFALLGPLEVSDGVRLLRLGGPKQRAVLAMLLLDANRPVPKHRLVDGVWGDRAPASAEEALDTYLSRLRRLLGPDRLSRYPAGYVLRVGPGELDLSTFEELLASAQRLRPTDPAAAAASLGQALCLWRGPALADLRYEPFASGVTDHLEERRLAAVELRAEAALAAGPGGELVPELEQLVGGHPTRERMVAHLMLALYRAGRQSDALAAMQACRRHLALELGLVPGPELCQLEQRILRHDEALAPALPSPPPSALGRAVPVAEARPRRRAWKWSAAASVITAAALVAALLAVPGHRAALAVASDANMLVAIASRSDHPTERVQLPAQPGAMAVAGGDMWVASPPAGAVLEVDPKQGTVVDRIPVEGEPGSLVSGGGALWVASTLGATVERIDPATATVTWTAQIAETGPVAMAYGDGGVWVADSTDQDLLELSAISGSVLLTFSLDVHPTSIALADGLVWVAAYDAGTVEAIDPGTGQEVGTVSVGNGPSAISFAGGYLWVANNLDNTVSAVDPATFGVVSTIAVGSGPVALVASQGATWVANQYSGTVSSISPQRLAVVGTVDVGDNPVALAPGPGGVWVAASAPAGGDRGGTLVLVSTQGFNTVDPAMYSEMEAGSFSRLAYDTLVTYEAAPGPDGLRLVPDLALQVPAPTDGGRTYSFRLRANIRYSNGALVKASDFRYALERLFALGSPGASFYSGLVGAGTCQARPGNCDLSQGVVTNDEAGLVVFHLSAPDPDFLDKLTPFAYAAPVPPGTPERDMGLTPVPGTGPYRMARATPREVVFERNPYFREWSHAAQPAGNPDEIIWRTLTSEQDVESQVTQGKADYTLDSIPPAELHALEVEDPSEVRSDPAFVVEFIPLNTRVPPFDSLLARRALNYAIDRRLIMEMYGGSTVATPACQPLLPGLLGYKRYCPYTLHPNADGAWTAPDLSLAKKLVDESGTKGDAVTVWGTPNEGVVPPQEAAYITNVLNSLGYRARLHMVSSVSITQPMWAKFQISVDGDWNPDYPAPSGYLPSFFACNGSQDNGYYCNPAIDQEMTEATLLELQSPAQAAAMWTKIDFQLTNQAEWVTTVDLNEVDITSPALRNYEFNPVNGFIADQAFVRR
jgi:YVTN family beta-propeller protein